LQYGCDCCVPSIVFVCRYLWKSTVLWHSSKASLIADGRSWVWTMLGGRSRSFVNLLARGLRVEWIAAGDWLGLGHILIISWGQFAARDNTLNELALFAATAHRMVLWMTLSLGFRVWCTVWRWGLLITRVEVIGFFSLFWNNLLVLLLLWGPSCWLLPDTDLGLALHVGVTD
jgi:hypothetical protein